ncbi:ShlB/FhaC/HecB family hemolysin secretion/activation protein [Flavobacterium stagni]|uniref:Haemolysin activator HlyB C-terminal domain-containing protein n=1 Tax=Flavobacterium stagni TaxID=2506421 RepID=A0A4Q1K918_9FLAO|nr:BamA/TamA family outer membrane protein [Flavobacterium stagni]RXR21945.1 hypothetical protein EQG61_10705 [Flavobacterium stagni]
MNKLFALLFTLASFLSNGQEWLLNMEGSEPNDRQLLLNFPYKKTFESEKELAKYTQQFLTTLHQAGFASAFYQSIQKNSPNNYTYHIHFGNAIRQLYIKEYKSSATTTFAFIPKENIIPFSKSEQYLNQLIQNFEKSGYAFAKIQLTQLQVQQDTLYTTLTYEPGAKRNVNAIVINGYDKFPDSHKKELERLFRNKTLNQETIEKLHKTINQFRFVRSVKYPEILFTKEATQIFTYIEKIKANTFDGYIGFTNNENGKLIFNGYVDGSLLNALNNGEKINVYWKSNGQSQRTFNLLWEQPYIFKSPLALKAQLNIFKQDSTFQNTQTNFDLGYCLSFNSRIYLGYQSAESSDIKNANTANLKDFKNNFLTAQWNWNVKNDQEDASLFPERTLFNFKIGTGKRKTSTLTNSQFLAQLAIQHQFYFNRRNSIQLKNQSFLLQSEHYLTNELFRFGGINSVRGFNENTLQANFLSVLCSEYRYTLSDNLYLHSVIDYGYFQDKTTQTSGNLLGLGFGFGLLNKNGLLNFVYANGSTNNQAVKLSNSIVQISLKTSF